MAALPRNVHGMESKAWVPDAVCSGAGESSASPTSLGSLFVGRGWNVESPSSSASGSSLRCFDESSPISKAPTTDFEALFDWDQNREIDLQTFLWQEKDNNIKWQRYSQRLEMKIIDMSNAMRRMQLAHDDMNTRWTSINDDLAGKNMQLSRENSTLQDKCEKLERSFQSTTSYFQKKQNELNKIDFSEVAMECPVCLVDVMYKDTDVFQCGNGHLICEQCKSLGQNETVCATCSLEGPLSRSLVIQELRTALTDRHDVEASDTRQCCVCEKSECIRRNADGNLYYQGSPLRFICRNCRRKKERLLAGK